jgi:hypothetical protein
VHSVQRAFRTGSVDEVIEPADLRPTVAAYLAAAEQAGPAGSIGFAPSSGRAADVRAQASSATARR